MMWRLLQFVTGLHQFASGKQTRGFAFRMARFLPKVVVRIVAHVNHPRQPLMLVPAAARMRCALCKPRTAIAFRVIASPRRGRSSWCACRIITGNGERVQGMRPGRMRGSRAARDLLSFAARGRLDPAEPPLVQSAGALHPRTQALLLSWRCHLGRACRRPG